MQKNKWLGHSCEKLLRHQQQHLQVFMEAECRFLSHSIYLASNDKWIPRKLAPGNPRARSAGWSEARTPKASSSWGQPVEGVVGRWEKERDWKGSREWGRRSTCPLSSAAGLNLCWVPAQMQVRRYRLEDAANTPSLDEMWCINKQALRAWQDCLSYLIQAILCPTQEFFLFVHFQVC